MRCTCEMKCNVLNENEISTNYEIYKIVPMAKFPLSQFIKETQYNFQFFLVCDYAIIRI